MELDWKEEYINIWGRLPPWARAPRIWERSGVEMCSSAQLLDITLISKDSDHPLKFLNLYWNTHPPQFIWALSLLLCPHYTIRCQRQAWPVKWVTFSSTKSYHICGNPSIFFADILGCWGVSHGQIQKPKVLFYRFFRLFLGLRVG